MKYVCADCKYQDICGDMERTQPCDDYEYDGDDFEDELCSFYLTGSCGKCRECDMWVSN